MFHVEHIYKTLKHKKKKKKKTAGREAPPS